jgi:hypothetical protein
MRRQASLIIRTIALLLLFPAGCDRDAHSTSGGNTTTPQPARKRLALQLTPITPLLPRLRTHVAVDSRGNLYWLQESEPPPADGDMVYAMGDSGVPQSIAPLNVPNLLAISGNADFRTAPTTGAIRAIAVGPDDQLYFFFSGGSGRATIAFLGRYDPKTSRVHVVADKARLIAESALGPSMELARPSLTSYGQELWLWLRHTDDAAILKIEPKARGVELRRLVLKPPEPASKESPKVRLISEEDDLSAGPQLSLYYVDRPGAQLWKIDSAGEFTSVLPLETFSSAVTPAAVDNAGRICLLAGDAARLHARSASLDSMPLEGSNQYIWSRTTFPAFLEIKGEKSDLIARDDFNVPVNYPVQTLQPQHLLFDRATETFISFDAATGELIRMKILRN